MLTFEMARRTSEMLLALAVVQQALEHMLTLPRDRPWAAAQAVLALAMAAGTAPAVVQGLLLFVSVDLLRHLQGPYNGGSDRMRLLLLACLLVSRADASLLQADAAMAMPTGASATGSWARVALGYLAVQVVLSYTIAGYVKLVNRDWRSGQALIDVLAFSVYPVSDGVAAWAGAARAGWWLACLAWMTIVFEVLFPLALLDPRLLAGALMAALGFHLVNACVFGLNRFVWSWIAAYPCLVWFQAELVTLLW